MKNCDSLIGIHVYLNKNHDIMSERQLILKILSLTTILYIFKILAKRKHI